jgi:regulator of protease activity HflC (stomatin/prohibitin superfamily)
MSNPLPRWGRVSARPHEFLIVVRDGRVRKSGQGLSVFKWPSDSVALVSTSIRKLSFKADQVTVEKAGVEVTGLAVYRVADPLLAYRMLDGDPRALDDILRDMFIGATRRIVASLGLDECITHRKTRVAAALMSEIAPVLAGAGRVDDSTDAGWGVVLDTIEIQDVRVLSSEVFARLQAPYREKLALEALRAKDEVTREASRLEAARDATAEQSRRALMQEEEARLVFERKRALEIREHADLVKTRDLEAELARKQRTVEAERERALVALDTRRLEGALSAELVRLDREAHVDLSDARLREIALTRTVPELAKGLSGAVSKLEIVSTDASVARLVEAGTRALSSLGKT